MIGRGDKDGVDLFADFVKHLPVIGERLKLFRIVPFSFKGLPNDFVPLFIHIDNSEHVFTRNRRQVGLEATPAHAADLRIEGRSLDSAYVALTGRSMES